MADNEGSIIQINCDSLDPGLRPLNPAEENILARVNEKLRDFTGHEGELRVKYNRLMSNLSEKIEDEPRFERFQYFKTYKNTPNDTEKGLLSKWKFLNEIWGWGEHNMFEKISHCNINSSQSWTDPIMRILLRGVSYQIDNTKSSSMSIAFFKYLSESDENVKKAFALWSVFFEEDGVLDLLKEIYDYQIEDNSCYTIAILVTFTRAWIEYCLGRNPKILLQNINRMKEESPDSSYDESSHDEEEDTSESKRSRTVGLFSTMVV